MGLCSIFSLEEQVVVCQQITKRKMSAEDFTLYFKSHFKGKGWSKHRAEGVDELVFLFNYNLKNFHHIYENNALIDMEVRGSPRRTTHPPNIYSPSSPRFTVSGDYPNRARKSTRLSLRAPAQSQVSLRTTSSPLLRTSSRQTTSCWRRSGGVLMAPTKTTGVCEH